MLSPRDNFGYFHSNQIIISVAYFLYDKQGTKYLTDIISKL